MVKRQVHRFVETYLKENNFRGLLFVKFGSEADRHRRLSYLDKLDQSRERNKFELSQTSQ